MKYIQLFLLILIFGSLAAIAFFLYKLTNEKPLSQEPVAMETTNTVTPTPTPLPSISGTPNPVVNPSPAAALATVNGKLCYPAEGIPPLRVFLKNTVSNTFAEVDTVTNQNSYQFANVAAGTYVAFAYTTGNNSLGGAYTPAVPCGLSVNCTNHTPTEVNVAAGSSVTNIDICDWYGKPSDVPAKPQ